MPTYSYRCTECDNAFDIHQAFTDDSLTVCEVCGGKLRKLFNTIGVTFNGSGFYRTDSRADGATGKSGAASASPAPGRARRARPASGSSGSGPRRAGSSAARRARPAHRASSSGGSNRPDGSSASVA